MKADIRRIKMKVIVKDLTLRIDVALQDDIFTSAANRETASLGNYYLVNGRLTWRTSDTKWETSLEVRNLLNEYDDLTILDSYEMAGIHNSQLGHPREIRFTIKRFWF
jgi:outer membrane receptor for ferric coprogen and ferric-rhodotorulic acid